MLTNIPGAQEVTQVVTQITSSTGNNGNLPNINPGGNPYLPQGVTKKRPKLSGFHSEPIVGVEAVDMLTVPDAMMMTNDVLKGGTLENVGPMVSCRRNGGQRIGLSSSNDQSKGLIIDGKMGNLNKITTGTVQERVGESVRLIALLTGLPNTAPGYPKELLQQKSGVLQN